MRAQQRVNRPLSLGDVRVDLKHRGFLIGHLNTPSTDECDFPTWNTPCRVHYYYN